MKKSALQLLTVIVSVLISGAALSDIIKKIEILGMDSISRGTVLSYIPVEVGDDYNAQVSDQIILDLYKTSFFKDIEVSQKNQVLKIKLLENPHIKFIEVVNYSDDVVEEKSLNQVLKSMDLSQGKIFNEKQLNRLVTDLEASYVDKGFYNIRIDKKIVIDAKNRVEIELDVSEGETAKINRMKITGGKIHDEKKLLNLFEIGEPPAFFVTRFFSKKDHYSKIALDAGLEAMKSLYINSGYLDFRIEHSDTNLSDDKLSIDIDIKISEGAQYKIGSIKFTGNLLDQTTAELKALLSVKTGDIFKRKNVIESIRTITDIFSDQGYAFAQINPITAEDLQAHVINLTIDVDLNQKVYVNRITIVGNTRTEDEVIRRAIGINEGGLYSNTELDESIKRIKKLGFFSDVKMDVTKLKEFNDKINLNFSVKETKTGTFSIGLSHSSESGSAFNLGIKEKNFLGTGNTLNATFTSSTAVQEASFYFSDPYFTQDGHSLSYGVFSKATDGSDLDLSAYEIDEHGFNSGYGIPLTDETRLKTDIRFSIRDVRCGETFAGADYEEEQCASDDESEVKLNVRWDNNTLDNYNYPTEGDKNKISFNLALPIADFRYYKLDLSHQSYYPLSKELTLTAKTSIGMGSGYSGKDLPFFKRYYGGGSSSVRGFNFNSLGITYDDGKAKGGELSMLASTSLIAPMTFVNDSKNMRMSAFIDAGSIEEKISGFGVDELRMSSGVAFSWITPVGPIGLYAAVPLIKKDDDEIKTFEFTLGNSF
jgi:outer membrane protein insertion porin family